jgi:CRISPR-associated protein Cmr6
MREALERSGVHKKPAGAHAGLCWSRMAPISAQRGDSIDALEKERIIDAVCGSRVPEFYARAFEAWREAVSDAYSWTFKLTSRLLVGHAEPSATGIGLTLHPTYGVPWIPGSAIKGLLSHHLGLSDDEWRGVGYAVEGDAPVTLGDGMPFRAPGKWSRALFGAPPTPRQSDEPPNDTQGLVHFDDAWLVPTDGDVLVPDVLTPHQKRYYDGKVDHEKPWSGKPVDWDDPNPVGFVTVKPGVQFLFSIGFTRGAECWAKLAFSHLRDALRDRGLGAKTSAGYGRFSAVKNLVPPSRASIAIPGSAAAAFPASPALQAFLAAVQCVVQATEGKVSVFNSQGFPALAEKIPALERPLAWRAFEPLRAHPKLKRKASGDLEAVHRVLAG